MKKILIAFLSLAPVAVEAADVVGTDQIIQGSQCVGFDCSSSESFGSDTTRLKENNLRMHFDDTSSSASFPGNDWRFTFNDSSNGGANYFSVDDATGGTTPFKVEAGAPSNTLVVESDGDVGIGTANPVVRIHAVKGDSPTLRLEQDGSSGFTPQTWDMAGNESNFFIRDVTNGSKLPFRIQPDSPQSSIFIRTNGVAIGQDTASAQLDVKSSSDTTNILRTRASDNTVGLTVDAAGNVGIGTESPLAELHLSNDYATNTDSFVILENTDTDVDDQTMLELRNANGGARIQFTDTAGEIWLISTQSSDGGFSISKKGTGATEFAIDSLGNVTIENNLTVKGTFSNP